MNNYVLQNKKVEFFKKKLKYFSFKSGDFLFSKKILCSFETR